MPGTLRTEGKWWEVTVPIDKNRNNLDRNGKEKCNNKGDEHEKKREEVHYSEDSLPG